MIKNVLSIAGSDPSGGAGVQADLKAFAANGVYGMAVITALTAQNTQGVSGVEHVPPAFVKAQIAAVFDDVRVDAIKIGMIATAEIARAVAASVAGVLAGQGSIPIVLDPVMVAKGGAPLVDEDAMQALKDYLLPISTFITPNLPESARLLGCREAEDKPDMESQATRLVALGPHSVLLKGGHLGGTESPDVLVSDGMTHWLDAPRTATKNTHGTGCTLSAALAAQLAKTHAPWQAASIAKAYVADAISTADDLDVGSGHGPIHHFHNIWRNENEQTD